VTSEARKMLEITGYKRLALEGKMWIRRLMPQIIFFLVVIVVVVVVVVVVVLVVLIVGAAASKSVAISTVIS